ncbi:c-type cytochrome biogenesis protein CcmI [Brevundimonas sp. UBA7534]|uniref:c-type cytochrome biogenesis protein CcmI n=1 Tax=Brevundimonas sp. UBA7534 TaxID=1946138 RepID=UPI0025C5DCC6|nr:c-type cytochrome biogenesis protein CcmI [Brevundimonas sp. UBA7534]
MIVFWMMTGLAAALAALAVLGGARRGATAAPQAETAAGLREIEELDRLKTRGLMDEAAHAAARAEAARRLLAGEAIQADRPVRAGPRDRLWVLAGIGASTAGALGLYVLVGAPGLPDQGYESRVDQWAETPDALQPPQLAAVVARVVRERPDDPQALAMLGAARFQADDPLGAASAFRRLVALRPDDGQAWARLGESLVRANEDRIGADAEAAFREAVRHDPDQLGARFFLGEAALRRGDAAETRAQWTPLIAALDPTDPRRQDLERRMPPAGAQ